jgi:hypothetical protein
MILILTPSSPTPPALAIGTHRLQVHRNWQIGEFAEVGFTAEQASCIV